MPAILGHRAGHLRAIGLDLAPLRVVLLRDGPLAPAVWARRHRSLTALLWLHALTLLVLGALLGRLDALTLAYLAAIVALAGLAAWPRMW